MNQAAFEYRFQLACGCVAVTTERGEHRVEWCPRHEAMHEALHGTMPSRADVRRPTPRP